MRHRRILIAATVAACAGLGAAISAGQISFASQPQTDAELVRPAFSDGETEFFTDAQIDDVWGAVTESYREALPAGYDFPPDAPGVLNPTDGRKHLFAAGLPDMIAAQYWRCSWLDASRTTAKAVPLGEIMARYAALPSVALYDETGYTVAMLQEFAKTNDYTTPAAALFALDCQGFVK